MKPVTRPIRLSFCPPTSQVFTITILAFLLLANADIAVAQNQQMPREDVVEFPAIGEGLCVSNAFQSNMVLQRDKPIVVWGWARLLCQLLVTNKRRPRLMTEPGRQLCLHWPSIRRRRR